jgi:hypothetical protein
MAITSRWCWWKSDSVGMVERRLSVVDAEAIDQPPETTLIGGAHMLNSIWSRRVSIWSDQAYPPTGVWLTLIRVLQLSFYF